MLTANRRADREIRTSRTVSFPILAIFIASGNNPTTSREIARRIVPIRIDARSERPELRTGFTHPDILAWAKESRGWLIWAALTLIQHWIAAGCPKGQRVLGKFEGWSAVMGGIAEVNGIHGFLDNLNEFRCCADTESTTLRAVVTAWSSAFGEAPIRASDLLGHVEQVLGLEGGARNVQLGRWLERNAGQIIDGFRICRAGSKANTNLWRLDQFREVADSKREVE